jgi:hypothetical protein
MVFITAPPLAECIANQVVENLLEEPVSEDLRIFGIDFDTDCPHLPFPRYTGV